MKEITVMSGHEELHFEKNELPTVESSATCACRDCEINEPGEKEQE